MKYIKFGIGVKTLVSGIISLGFAHISDKDLTRRPREDDIQEIRVKVDYNNTCSVLFDTYVIDDTSTELVKCQAKLLIKADGNTIYSINRKVKYRGYPESEPVKCLYATLVWRYNQHVSG